jgi:hypothetical protein
MSAADCLLVDVGFSGHDDPAQRYPLFGAKGTSAEVG